MAVEILAAVECVLAGEGHAVRQLGAGLIERATRLPGGSNPAAEFADLPTLAEVYVLGPLEMLSGGPASATLPAPSSPARCTIAGAAACAAYPPAAAFGASAAELVRRTGLGSGWPPRRPPRCLPRGPRERGVRVSGAGYLLSARRRLSGPGPPPLAVRVGLGLRRRSAALALMCEPTDRIFIYVNAT